MRLSRSTSFLVALVASAALAGEPSGRSKRLIEFEWDEPDTWFLRTHLAQIEKTPFDGCVFHVDAYGSDGKSVGSLTWRGWGRRAFKAEELDRARLDLEAVARSARPGATHLLRFNTAPADLDWFDDHSAVMINAKHAARLAKLGRCRGILFDTEQYEGKLFDFAKQRDAKTKSWADYAAQAKRRGAEVMDAFQSEFPDVHILLTFGHSYPLRQLKGRPADQLASTPDGLLAPFLDGMISVARGSSKIVDGHELSYGYKERAEFERARERMKTGVAPIVADTKAYQARVEAGFGIWLDNDWREKAWSETDFARNHFTPKEFEASVAAALALSDEYVWIYTEQPRWWTPEGRPAKLPTAYAEALRRAADARLRLPKPR